MKNLKILIAILYFAQIFCINTIAQNNNPTHPGSYWKNAIQEPNADFLKIREEAKAYYQANSDARGYKSFIRWETYWQDRVYKAGENQTSFNYAREAYNTIASTSSRTGGTCWGGAANGSNWQYISQTSQSTQNMGIVVSVAVDPTNHNVIYAGTNASGLWKTTNGGQSWTCMTDGVGLPGMGVEYIAISPLNNQELYIATGLAFGRDYGAGILRSTDGGQTWMQTGMEFQPTDHKVVKKILIEQTGQMQQTIYAAVNHQVFRSTNNGGSWTPIFTHSYHKRRINDMELQLGVSSTLFLAVEGGSIWDETTATYITYNAEIYYTTNRLGSTPAFNQMINSIYNNTEKIMLAVTPAENSSLFIGFTDNSTLIYQNYKTQNLGSNWISLFSYGPIAPYSYGSPFCGVGYWQNELEISLTDPNIAYVGGFEVTKVDFSTQSHFHYTYRDDNSNPPIKPTINNHLHVDIRAMKVLESGLGGVGDIVLVGNDGGVSKLVNGVFQNINGTGLNISQFYGFANTDSDADLVVGGTQDNGVFTRNSGWKVTIVGDAYDAVVDYNNNNILYCLSNGGIAHLSKSTNKGLTWSSVSSYPSSEPSRNNRPIVIHPSNSQILYVGHKNLYRTTDGNNFVKYFDFESAFGTQQVISAIAISKSNPNYIYVAFDHPTWDGNNRSKKLFKSTNGGTSWTDIGSTLLPVSWVNITNLEVHPTNPNALWVSFGGFWISDGTARVYYSGNTGTTPFSDVSAGLPNLPVNSIRCIEGSNNHLYAATDVGVYFKNGSNNWVCFSENLPVSIVTDLEVNYCKGVLRASTFGRGIWESPLHPYTSSFVNPITSSATWADKNIMSHISIESGVTITVNGSLNVGKGKNIVIKNGGRLIIDGGKIKNNCLTGQAMDGSIEINPGGILEIKSGAELRLRDNGKIHAQHNSSTNVSGEIIYHPGASIVLLNSNTHIDFQGVLTIRPNANFTFTGAGFIRFNRSGSNSSPNVKGFSTSTFTISGTGNNNKKMEILQPFYVQPVVSFNFTNAAAHLAEAGKLKLDGPATFNNTRITSITGVFNNHKGLEVIGQNNLLIENSIFEFGSHGIDAFLANNKTLEIKNCTFKNNAHGLKSIYGGVTLEGNHFENNDHQGIRILAAQIPSYLKSNTIRNSSEGIYFVTGSGSDLTLNRNSILDNYHDGVYFSGNARINISCGSIRNNQKGIHLAQSASINMSPSGVPPSGKVNVSNNLEYAIYNYRLSPQYGTLELQNGLNNLSGGLMAVNGRFQLSPRKHEVPQNRWNQANTTPVAGVDYLYYGSHPGGELIDNNPGSGSCPFELYNIEYADLLESPSILKEYNDQEYWEVNQSEVTALMMRNLGNGLDNLSNGDYISAIGFFEGNFGGNFEEVIENPSPFQEMIINYSYNYLKYSIRQGYKEGILIEGELDATVSNLLVIQNARIDLAVAKDDFLKRYTTSMDKAQTLILADLRNDAINEFYDILSWADPEDHQFISKWICWTNLEIEFISNPYGWENFSEAVESCENFLFSSFGGADSLNMMQSLPLDNNKIENTEKVAFNIKPNPTTGFISVESKSINNIRVIDILGKTFINLSFSEEKYVKLDLTSLPKGVYFIWVSDGENSGIKKIILQ